MGKSNQATILQRIRHICLDFPEAAETETWGKPHFRVTDKIFAGCGEEDGNVVLGCKLQMEHAKKMIQVPGFWKARYVGHKGWISMNATEMEDWDLVKELIEESYRLIAPKKLVAQLDHADQSLDGAATKSPATKKKAIRKKK